MSLREWIVGVLRPHAFRGKPRLLNWLVPNGGERFVEIFGVRTKLDIGEHIQRNIYLGHYEPTETRLVARWLRSGMTFVDVGANVGYFSFLAASRVGPTGRVLAIEPSPEPFARLQAAIQENPLEQLHAVQVAVAAEAGEKEMYVHPWFSPRFKGRFLRTIYPVHSPSLVANEGWDEMRVPVLPLEQVLEDARIGTVDLLKLDVEGFEPEVLRGAQAVLEAGRVRALLCEFNPPALQAGGSSAEALYQMLVDCGFEETESASEVAHGGVENRFFVHRRA